MSTAIVLVAHGSRDPGWAQGLQDVREAVVLAHPDVAVELAYLEFVQPTLEQVVRDCCDRGVTRLQVIPLFLGIGHHVRVDLPNRLDALRSVHPELQLHALPALGAWPQLHAMVAACAGTFAQAERAGG